MRQPGGTGISYYWYLVQNNRTRNPGVIVAAYLPGAWYEADYFFNIDSSLSLYSYEYVQVPGTYEVYLNQARVELKRPTHFFWTILRAASRSIPDNAVASHAPITLPINLTPTPG